jgi:serine/threonine protein kinase
MYEMMTLKTFNYQKYLKNLNNYLREEFDAVKDQYDELLIYLTSKCLSIDPIYRLTSEQLLNKLNGIQKINSELNTEIDKELTKNIPMFESTPLFKKNIFSPLFTKKTNRFEEKESSDYSLIEKKPKEISTSYEKKIIETNIKSENDFIIQKNQITNSEKINKIKIEPNDVNITNNYVFEKSKVIHWTIDDVCLWLDEMGYSQYQVNFKENDINGEALLELSFIFIFIFLRYIG